MKISLISLGTTGAGPVYSFEMAKALASNDKCVLQVVISENVTNLEKWKSAFENSAVEFCVIKTYDHTKLSAFLSLFNFPRMNHLVKLVKSFGADVVYMPFGLLWSNFVFRKLYKTSRIVITMHDVQLHDSFHNIIEYMLRKLSNMSQKYVDDIIILNKKDLSSVVSLYKKRVAVIPHASFSYYVKTNKKQSQNINYCIGFLGRIEPYKGLDILIDAFGCLHIPNLKLIIAGIGKIESRLLSKINNDNRIILINRYIADEEFETLMDQIDFVVLPYKRASQSGVIPMAYAFGKAVIATNVGALAEQVTPETGLLVEPNSIEISRQINNLYSDPERILTLGKNAKHYANTKMTWEHSASLLLNYLENI